MEETRLDKWLWSVRVFKTRPEAKPGRIAHIGETVSAKVGLIHRTLKVLGVPRSRVSAKQLPDFVQDLTPPEEYAKAKQAQLEHLLARERGKGRPTKKDRRDMGELFGFE